MRLCSTSLYLNCSCSKARNSLTAGDAGLSPNETCVGVKAFICSDHRKSLFCTMVWQFMQPVRILVWSQVSRIVLANAELAAPAPGKVKPGDPGFPGELGGLGH